MEHTYSDFMRDASQSVSGEYAKRLIETIRKTDGQGSDLFSSVGSLVQSGLGELLQMPDWVGSAAVILLFALLFRLLRGAVKSSGAYRAVDYFTNLLLAAVVIRAVLETLNDCAAYMQDISLFFGALAPVIGLLTASGGNVAAAGTGSLALSVFLAVAEWVVNRFAPIIFVLILGLSLIGLAAGTSTTLSLVKGVRNFLFGAFSFVTAIFFIVVGCQNIAAANTDTIGARTLRLLVSNAVPIVGGTVGDTLKLVSGSLVTVKNATGLSSVVFLLAMYCPVLLKLWFSGLILSLLGFLCECAELENGKSLFGQVKCAFDFALAAYTSVFVMGMLNIGLFIGSLPAVAT